MKVEVLGEDCGRCDKLAHNVSQALFMMGRTDPVVRINDPTEIAERGVWKTPALVVDGHVELIDAVPNPGDIIVLLSGIHTSA